jgi:D-sedoheptulose 7-phosphate isomerase
MSAIGNEYGYDQVFKRKILALGNANHIFIPISTSGNSANVLDAINAAKKKTLKQLYSLQDQEAKCQIFMDV